MNIIRIYLLEKPDGAKSYEEWVWKLEENYQFKDNDDEDSLAKKRVERDAFYDGDRGFVSNYQITIDLDNIELNCNYLKMPLRLYKHLLKKKRREEALDSILKNNR